MTHLPRRFITSDYKQKIWSCKCTHTSKLSVTGWVSNNLLARI